MDNHRAALWVWLTELSPDDRYSLFHIDWHWDCTEMPQLGIDRIRDAEPLTLAEFLGIESSDPEIPLIRWDNYIDPLPFLRPNAGESFLTAHQDVLRDRIFEDPRFHQYERPEFLLSELTDLLEETEGKILFNLDLDFFVWRIGGNQLIAFSNELIEAIIDQINLIPKERLVLTVAWSPECSGGWHAAANLCRIVCNRLGIECPAEQLTGL